jgi:hypothetical protein
VGTPWGLHPLRPALRSAPNVGVPEQVVVAAAPSYGSAVRRIS